MKCISSNSLLIPWGEKDEMRWRHGFVLCVLRGGNLMRFANPDEFPPSRCPYAAEHVVFREAEQ